MYHIRKATGAWHVEGVDVHLTKKRAGDCYDVWDVNLTEMSGLTDVARVCKPFYVYVEVRPPEAFDEVGTRRIHTTVTYLIVSLG